MVIKSGWPQAISDWESSHEGYMVMDYQIIQRPKIEVTLQMVDDNGNMSSLTKTVDNKKNTRKRMFLFTMMDELKEMLDEGKIPKFTEEGSLKV